MTKKKMYALITASIALLVPAPGRFAYGLILVVLLMLLVTLGTVYSAAACTFSSHAYKCSCSV